MMRQSEGEEMLSVDFRVRTGLPALDPAADGEH